MLLFFPGHSVQEKAAKPPESPGARRETPVSQAAKPPAGEVQATQVV